MKKGDKRAQFYLIASIMVVAVIITLGVFSNYVKKNRTSDIYDIAEELKIESASVIEYGVLNNDLIEKIDDFTKKYSEYVGDGTDIYFISGSDVIEVYKWTDGSKVVITSFETPGETIEVAISGTDYSCEIKEGYNFYFVIIQEESGEKYVVKSNGCAGVFAG